MTAPDRPRKVMGLSFPTEEERVVVALGRSRDHALSAAAAAVVLASAPDDPDPADVTRLRSAATAYAAALEQALTPQIEQRFRTDCAADIACARQFADHLNSVAQAPAGPDRAAAMAVLHRADDAVLPALVHLTECILRQAAIDQNAVLDAAQARNDKLESLFHAMRQVGRTLDMVSINTAVEASRAGGDQGRAFGVIAAEVRTLARRVSELSEQASRSIDG
ncbi:methyl-accepting chemotaxis protein [Jannaschia donghaensis]|uniref:Chemotaxis regulator BdlA n=1 Tax=Jannaschia donghaensis TaxID=420998 RepID=A0A0M6YEL7_9RHOB|nr:methyl-accepting chemotaxis protein [Jannaschia donghaensis]CTQ48802.1 Chemotaxis regulator BdlA [Jannaschia donghaensis]